MKFKNVKFITYYKIAVNNKIYKLRNRGRHVYIGPKFVIKSWSSWEYDCRQKQTRNEIRFYLSKLKNEDRKYFPKLFAYDLKKAFLIQERIKFKRGRLSSKQTEILNKLIKKYKFTDISCERGWKYNCGVKKNGTPVIYDFAY